MRPGIEARAGPCQGRYHCLAGSYMCPFEALRALTSHGPLESRGSCGNARVMNSGALEHTKSHALWSPPRALAGRMLASCKLRI